MIKKGNIPRLDLLDASRVIHHISIRSFECRKIFRGNRHRNNFLECLRKHLLKTKMECHARAFSVKAV